MSFWPTWKSNPLFYITINVLIIALICLALFQVKHVIYKTAQVGEPEPREHTITVSGEGRVSIAPDLATVNLGVESSAPTVEEAQTKNTEVMNTLTGQVKALGIDAADLQTQFYSVYEDEYWNPDTGEYISIGWIVSQQLQVRIRDTAKVPEVLAVAGRNGVTNIYGPSFEVDDPESQLGDARDEAITDAYAKAREIANSLGVRLGEIVAYDEYAGGGGPVYRDFALAEMDGMGGAPSPSIETGSEELTLNVTVTYLIGN